MNKRSIRPYIAVLLMVLLFMSCVKEKLNSSLVPPGGLNQSNSSVRVYNLYGFNMDVTVNNIPLTPYGAASGNTYSQAIFGGGYFKDGASFTVPNYLLDKAGKVHIVLKPPVQVC